MSWGEVEKINSWAKKGVPLNHLIWLNDYKTYGENSYVFQDKRILKELYASPIAANDVNIYEEAKTYNKTNMTVDRLAKWLGFRYEFSDRNNTELRLMAKGFNSWTDEELSSALEMHYNNEIDISKCAFVGEKRSVTLSAMTATGVRESHREQTVEFAIADFNHDDLTTPINDHAKAAITLTQVDCLMDDYCEAGMKEGYANLEIGHINSSDTTVGGWNSCARRGWCNDIYYNSLPSGLKSLVKAVNKLTSAGSGSTTINTTSDNVFLPSEIEVFGSTQYSFAGEGTQYPYYITTSNRFKKPLWDRSRGTFSAWWQRSPRNNAEPYFCMVGVSGNAECSTSTNEYGLAPCLCI